MGREDVVKFVESEFHITPQSSWVDYFVNKNADEIAFVNAKPMESERLGVTKEIIDKHFKNLKYFLAKCDPNLIINMDETGDQLKAKSSNKRVLLSVKEDTQNHYYREQRSDSHISFVAAIATDFTFFRPMVITTKSSCEDIEHLGLPDGSFGLIVGSPNGYMTSDLMEMWIKKILLPEIEYRRMGMNKKNAVAGLILDGHTSHINEVTKELFQKNKVEYFLLPPHSSHLTQPLDRLIFSNFTKFKSKISISDEKFTKQSSRILRGLKALAMACTPIDITSSFKRSGIVINNLNGHNIIKINKMKVYKHLPGIDTASLKKESEEESVPTLEIKTPKTKRKRRVKIYFSEKKKKKTIKIKPDKREVLFPVLKAAI